MPLLVRDNITLEATVTEGLEPVEITGFTSTGIAVAELTVATNVQTQVDEFLEVLVITGGDADYYDGANLVELGFHIGPENISFTPKANIEARSTIAINSFSTPGTLTIASTSSIGAFSVSTSAATARAETATQIASDLNATRHSLPTTKQRLLIQHRYR